MTNSSGSVSECYAYAPYGRGIFLAPDGLTVRSSSAIGNSVLFTGRRFDPETGLFYYRARYYDSALGRFLGRDPMNHGARSVLRDNTYSYAALSPLDNVDPLGLLTIKPVNPKPKLVMMCGQVNHVEFDFKFQKHNKKAPCDGYFVQWVRIWRKQNPCKDCDECNITDKNLRDDKPDVEYLEAWPVKDGAEADEDHAKLGYTDQFRFRNDRLTCGMIVLKTEARFYCRSDTGDLGRPGQRPNDPNSPWRPGDDGGVEQADKLPSLSVPPFPDWWKNGKGEETPGRNSWQWTWSCCDAAKDDHVTGHKR